MGGVTLEGIAKHFGSQSVLDGLSLEVAHGEFLTILGPSGSGKSTLLRLVAGLDAPDAGRILIGGRVVCGQERWVPPQRREVGMVFQSYALWPHMTALENVLFPLAMQGMARRDATQRAREVLELVELAGFEARRPGQMSGGEQQRVALARALVARPAILLLDECLSNLDARLRSKMAGEMRRIQEAAGVTAIYVTHDPEEAFILSDRLAVLEEGHIQQVGRPDVVYARPHTPQVGTALGALNVLWALEAVNLGLLPSTDAVEGHLSRRAQTAALWNGPASRSTGDALADVLLGVRPEHVRLTLYPPEGDSGLRGAAGRINRIISMGAECHCWVQLGPHELRARLQPGPLHFSRGDQAWVDVAAQDWIILGGA